MAEVPQGLEAITLPAGKYAVFTSRTGPVSQVVPEVWKSIWDWSAVSPVRRAFTGDFERYQAAHFDPEQAVVQIYIAVE